jgi:hypothetical protein
MSPGRIVALAGGAAMGAFFALIAFAVGIVGGLDRFQQHWGVPVLAAIGGYLLSGLAAGMIASMLLPLAERPFGAVVVGYLAALPFALVAALSIVPRNEWWPSGLATAGIVACIGAVAGGYLWQEFHGSM